MLCDVTVLISVSFKERVTCSNVFGLNLLDTASESPPPAPYLFAKQITQNKAAATQSIAYAMYAMFAMDGKNRCLYGQRKGPHKTAYAMYAMLAT